MSSSQFNFKSSGFKTTNRKFTQKKTVARPVGIKTPLEEGDDIFKMHKNPTSQVADNLRNLILTNKGERLGRYNFGANLKAIVFEYSNSPNFNQIITDVIISEVQKYIPSIQILDIDPVVVDRSEKNDNNKIGLALVRVRINYIIPSLKTPNLGLEVDILAGG